MSRDQSVRFTTIGGGGVWPSAGRACGGYLVECDSFRILIDPGYATAPELFKHIAAKDVNAILISHGHPDHCSDLNPLLRARTLGATERPAAVPVYAPPGAVDRVLALDQPAMLKDAFVLHEFQPGADFEVGPFHVATRILPHFVPNAGMRLTASGKVIAYTGDSGWREGIVELSRGADVLLAEATYVDALPHGSGSNLSSAAQAGESASAAGVKHLILTHLWPDSDPAVHVRAAQQAFHGRVDVAVTGLTVQLT
jgi:ribonuclease BN (tRNA processing enzyme)